jgi:hypothetical protein
MVLDGESGKWSDMVGFACYDQVCEALGEYAAAWHSVNEYDQVPSAVQDQVTDITALWMAVYEAGAVSYVQVG